MEKNQFKIMTETPVGKLILKLCMPTILSMLVTNFYNLVDTAFVGMEGNSASGAVGIVFGFMAVLQAIGFLFGQGSGSIISRALGGKKIDKAGEVASTAFFTAFFLAVAAGIFSLIFIDDIVFFLGSTETIAPYAKKYISFIILTAPFLVTSFTLNNILRYEGKAALGMIGLITGAVLNIAGDAIFMRKFKMGITGAGLSTAISQFISFCILFSMFARGKTQCVISLKKVCLDFKIYSDIILTGLPSLLRQGAYSFAAIIMNVRAACFGDAGVAAMSIVSRIFFFIFSLSIGVGQGFQPVAGFNYGAKKFSRVRKGSEFTFAFSSALMVIASILVALNSNEIIRLFRDDALVIEIARRSLILHCVAVIFLPFCMVCEMVMQSTGFKLGASVISLMRSGLILIPCIILLTKFRGLKGLQEAQPLSFVLAVIPSVFFGRLYFKKLPKNDG